MQMQTSDTKKIATIQKLLASLYPEKESAELLKKLLIMLAHHQFENIEKKAGPLPQEAILITYGDQIQNPPLSAFAAQHSWLKENMTGIDAVHILPFYPFSSDDGFSVIDYRQTNPDFGTWDDIEEFAGDFTLMFDAVVNHISAKSDWFKKFLAGEDPYTDYFLTRTPDEDLSAVTRPRTSPLLHPFETRDGTKHVWTTFSADQIDLNINNPEVLFAVIDLLLFYVSKGAKFIRLDAVGFIWKKAGSSCMSLPETHACVQLIRSALDYAAPGTVIVTETNVPHDENISYFGNGLNEAQMVYQFALPPLLLDAAYRGDTSVLTDWARSVSPPSKETTFFNMTATHDGIGLRGASAYLSSDQSAQIATNCLERGGKVMYRSTPDGDVPYECNITFFDALLPPEENANSETAIDRYLTVQAVALSLQGIPGIYIHNLFGTRNYIEGFEKTQQGRTLNRRKFQKDELDAWLADPSCREARIFNRYIDMVSLWKDTTAFHPQCSQQILSFSPALFAVLRGGETETPLLALHNFTNQVQKIDKSSFPPPFHSKLKDLISEADFFHSSISIAPYRTLWMQPG